MTAKVMKMLVMALFCTGGKEWGDEPGLDPVLGWSVQTPHFMPHLPGESKQKFFLFAKKCPLGIRRSSWGFSLVGRDFLC
jgi:hypothetical protein